MGKFLRWMLLAALLFVYAGCSGAKVSRTGSLNAPTKFEFGRSTTLTSLYNVVVDVLSRYGYYRTQSGNTTFIESDWHTYPPDQAEVERAITETRHRLEITLVSRRATAEATLHLSCEGRIENGPWLKIPPNPTVTRVVEDMQREVKQALSQIITQW
jgi:hypothetical protein